MYTVTSSGELIPLHTNFEPEICPDGENPTVEAGYTLADNKGQYEYIEEDLAEQTNPLESLSPLMPEPIPEDDMSTDCGGENKDEVNNSKTKKKRCDRKNFCIFCECLVTNFRRHLLRNHTSERQMIEYTLLLERDSEGTKKERQLIF